MLTINYNEKTFEIKNIKIGPGLEFIDPKLTDISLFAKIKEKEKGEPTEKPVSDTGIADVMGPDTDVTGQDPKGFPTIDVPVRLGLDILKTLKLKADILFKHGDKGSRTLDSVDGKIDTLDISLKTNLPLFTTLDILNFLL